MDRRIGDLFCRTSRLVTTGTKRTIRSVGAIVRELQFQAEVLRAKQGNDGLQFVPVLAGDSYGIALDAGLRLLLRIFYKAHDLLSFFHGNALLKADLLAHTLPHSGLNFAVCQVLERDATLG